MLRRAIALVLVVVGAWPLIVGGGALAQEQEGAVHVIDISGEIDRGVGPYLDRAIEEAAEAGAAAVLLEIDTPGGYLDAALQIRNSLLGSPLPTISHIDRWALSAGALIALSTEQVYVAPGSSYGAATPVDQTGQPADEKVISALRSTFAATAEERGRDPDIARAMVDPAVEVEGVVAAGELLTLTDREALDVAYADGSATTRSEVLALAGLEDRAVVETSPSFFERVVRFLTNPLLASLIFTLGILMIFGELLSGGLGIATAIGAGLIGVFFYGHLLAGLTGWEDAILVLIGIALVLVEIFVIPGFGVAGVLGTAALLGGGFLAMNNRDWEFVSGAQMASTAGTLLLTFIVLSILFVVTLSFLSRRARGAGAGPGTGPALAASVPTPGGGGSRRGWLRWFGDGDVLASEDDEEVPPEEGAESHDTLPSSARTAARQGAIGTALSDLRPAGVANFEGQRVDVVTEGDYIAAGDRVEVVRAERYRRVVKRAPQPPADQPGHDDGGVRDRGTSSG
jgi:membrane-bound serine protease (ClpP class)